MIFFRFRYSSFVVYFLFLGTHRHKKFTFLYSLSWLAHPVARDLPLFYFCWFSRLCVSFLHANIFLLWLRFAKRLHEIGVTCLHFIRSVLGYGYVVVAFAVLLLLPFLVRARLISVVFFFYSFSSVYVHGSHRKKHV